MPPPVISVVSKKNSGKTTLLEKLIPVIKQRGYRVGTIKHDTHGFEIDHEGKDSWRHKHAGAATVVIASPWKVSVIKDVDAECTIDALVGRYFTDVDIVITEGYKHAAKPQIEVFRSQVHASPLHTKEQKNTLLAVMSDIPVDLGVPCFNINDVTALADFIVHRYLRQDESAS